MRNIFGRRNRPFEIHLVGHNDRKSPLMCTRKLILASSPSSTLAINVEGSLKFYYRFSFDNNYVDLVCRYSRTHALMFNLLVRLFSQSQVWNLIFFATLSRKNNMREETSSKRGCREWCRSRFFLRRLSFIQASMCNGRISKLKKHRYVITRRRTKGIPWSFFLKN